MTRMFVALVFLFASCASTPPPASTSSSPAPLGTDAKLYDRLGGKDAIAAVVDLFLHNVATDTRIQHRFALTDLGDLRTKLIEQICQATGGPCVYSGKDMVTVHKGMRVTDAEFTALVEDLVAALDTAKVPAREKNELLGALGGMKKDIVEVHE